MLAYLYMTVQQRRRLAQKRVENFVSSKNRKDRFAKFILLLLPIAIFGMGLLRTGNNLPPGDGDYYIQLYEAARRSILEFHQFPWWNPWVAGGVPLFANPQFGPISIQMITTLIFGSILGYKLALIIYLALGFFGLRKLMINIMKSEPLRATLLSYIWIFSSFFVLRAAGHYTFFIAGIFPWTLYFLLKRDEGKNWLWLALTLSSLVWASMHYTTILSIFIIALFLFADLTRKLVIYLLKSKNNKSFKQAFDTLGVKKLVAAGLVFLVLAAPKIYSTLEYSGDYPRLLAQVSERTTTIDTTWYSLFGPDQYNFPPESGMVWSWMESGTYIGFLTFFALLICVYEFMQRQHRKTFIAWTVIAFTLLFILLGRADFASWAPFTILREFPVFSSMRVATRWIAWAALFILLFMSLVRFKKAKLGRLVNLLLIASVIELGIVGFKNLDNVYLLRVGTYQEGQGLFSQREEWHSKRSGIPYDENFTEATRNNIGQIIAGDSLIDTRPWGGALPTIRCDETHSGCSFISGNAKVTSWSPNKLVIERLSSGPITLNMNAGNHWTINGNYVFGNQKVVDPSVPFIITDASNVIEVAYEPRFSPIDMSKKVLNKLTN